MVKWQESNKLLLTVLAATATRVFTLWIDKAEFAGWLNHTTYYFVQVRGLLQHGTLAYKDMPLLFYLYGMVAKGFGVLGVEQNDAIVISTRLIMCLAPSLIAIPIYHIVKRINGQLPIQRNQWILIFLAGFLPLSVSYMPEFLQKNMFGLLILSTLLYYSRRLFEKAAVKDAVISVVLALVIVLSHYGTFAAMVLYGLAAFLAFSVVSKNRKNILIAGLALASAIVMASALTYLFDPQRFERLFVYLNDSLANSLLLAFLNGGNNQTENMPSLGGLAIFYLLLFLFYRVYHRYKSSLAIPDRIFWLANILFSGLLLLPILDQQLMGRLALFLSIPLLIILIYNEKYGFKRPWLKTWIHILLAVAAIVLAFGELMSSRIHNRNHEQIVADIKDLQSQHPLDGNDLILTPTGADHVCNWFLGVKAGVITSLNLRDFETYHNVYVLNPIEGNLNFQGIENRTIKSEADKYLVMRRNIPKPKGIEPLFQTENIEFFKLEEPPMEWTFTDDGSWSGYTKGND